MNKTNTHDTDQPNEFSFDTLSLNAFVYNRDMVEKAVLEIVPNANNILPQCLPQMLREVAENYLTTLVTGEVTDEKLLSCYRLCALALIDLQLTGKFPFADDI